MIITASFITLIFSASPQLPRKRKSRESPPASDEAERRNKRRKVSITASPAPSRRVRDLSVVSSRSVINDDKEGHLVYRLGEIIQGRYKVLGSLGEGTFGKVLKVLDLPSNQHIALKIIKNVKKYREAARLEINVLTKLSKIDPEGKFLCVKMLDYFDYQ